MIRKIKTLAKRVLPHRAYADAIAAARRNFGWQLAGILPSRKAIRTLSGAERARALARSVWMITSGGVEGDVAEFGTMSGMTAMALARAISVTEDVIASERVLHLFDSFEGLPEATSPIDQAQPFVQSGWWAKGNLKGIPEHVLAKACGREYRPDRVRTYAGWFSDTVSQLPAGTRLALLHVDGDLYQSCIDALEPCFRNGWISEGAIIHFDDWNTGRASDALGERRAWIELAERYQVKFTFGGFYAEAGSWLIVHAYSGSLGT